MRARRAILTGAAIVLVVAAPSSAMAGLPGPAAAATSALTGIDQRLAPARTEAKTLRRMLEDGSVGSAVRAAARASGNAQALDGVRLDRAAPSTLRRALASIVAAVGRADRIIRHGAAARLASRYTLRQALGWAAGASPPPGLATVSPVPALRAAALIGSAVDGAMPALRAAAASTPSSQSDGTAPACDLLDEPQTLCVGGTGNNLYTANEKVLIDLGGDDTYANGAGYASESAAVVVDLSGNDRYDPTGLASGQGVGFFGGAGLLVDGGGEDTYRVASTATGGAAGQGVGVFGGVGILLDGGGTDTYTLDSVVQGAEGATAGAGGQGDGVFAGVGVLADAGVSDDKYVAHAEMVPQPGVRTDDNNDTQDVTEVGDSSVAGQGYAGAGAAILFDGGGSDSFSQDAHIDAAPPNGAPVPVFVDTTNTLHPSVFAIGQAYAALAPAFLLEGAGATTYSQRAIMDHIPLQTAGPGAAVDGQGNGTLGAVGVLSDAGGDDTYSETASADTSVSFTAGDECECSQDVAAASGPTFIRGQGYGNFGAIGLLDDAAGNDVFSADASNSVDLSIDDRRSSASPSLGGEAVAGSVDLGAQGVGFTDASLGVLAAAAGDDSYSTTSDSSAHADGTSQLPENAPGVTAAPGTVTNYSQGAGSEAGTGAIVDLGGSDDYSGSAAASSSVGDADPSPAAVALHVQGAADTGTGPVGLAIDLDGGAADTYLQLPAGPACQGTRGQGVWQDCSPGGIGVNE
jgi:hypothetical protein